MTITIPVEELQILKGLAPTVIFFIGGYIMGIRQWYKNNQRK